jgi:hypothetical protein
MPVLVLVGAPGSAYRVTWYPGIKFSLDLFMDLFFLYSTRS